MTKTINTSTLCKRYATTRKRSNIKDIQGHWILEQNDITKEFKNRFSNTFNGDHDMQGAYHIHSEIILKARAKDWLQRPFEEEEIFQSLKLCGKDKAPGPDGFTVKFYLNNWECIKQDILKAVKNFRS